MSGKKELYPISGRKRQHFDLDMREIKTSKTIPPIVANFGFASDLWLLESLKKDISVSCEWFLVSIWNFLLSGLFNSFMCLLLVLMLIVGDFIFSNFLKLVYLTGFKQLIRFQASGFNFKLLAVVSVCVCVCVYAKSPKSPQSCSTLCSPMDYSSPGSPVHGILQAKCWNGLPCPPPGDLPWPMYQTCVS